MSDLRDELEDLLDGNPDVEDDLREILTVDAESDSWMFDDVPVDSGTFGEIVSRGLVTKTSEGEYEVADREAMAAALNRDPEPNTAENSSIYHDMAESVAGFSLPAVNSREVGGLAGVLSLLAIFRLFPYGSVFRNGDIVLSANDPYFYRYHVGEMLARANGPFDFGALSSIPIPKGEPLLVAVLWWVTALLGGESGTGDLVLAWYPVVTAVLSGLCLYVLAVRLTDDVRVGLATVGLLAVMPAHAIRTGVGFADHHPFDLLWLSLTATVLVFLSGSELRDLKAWGLVLVFGSAVGAQTLAWEAGPLLLVPIGLYVAVRVVVDVRDGTPPGAEHALMLVGLGLGAVLVHLVHTEYGWHTDAVAAAPLLLFAGSLGVVCAAEAVHRFDGTPQMLLGVELIGSVAGIFILPVLFPTVSEAFGRGFEFLFETGGIRETRPLFADSLGGIVAPFFHFGFLLLLAFPYMIWLAWRVYQYGSDRWLIVLAYGWVFFLLSLVQVRFASELALFAALFAGFGLVHLASWVDLAEPPALIEEPSTLSDIEQLESPGRRNALRLTGLTLGVSGLGAILTPIEHGQVVIDGDQYQASQFLRNYAEERGWEYPQSYVFSRWGTNRFYNWFVNGEAESYSFAQQNFSEFARATDGKEWYERLRDRAGFVVVPEEGPSNDEQSETIHEQLWGDGFGIETNHYRAIWASQSDSLRAFTLVPGATVTGPAEPNSTARLEVSTEIGEQSKSLRMTAEAGEHGVFREIVPLPGIYDVGDASVTVSEGDVVEGNICAAFEGEGYAYWPFDEGSGDWAYDRAGGHHGRVQGAEWADSGRSGSALSFDGKSGEYVEAPVESSQEFTISLWAYPTALDVSENNDYRDVVHTRGGSILIFEENGRVSFRLPGSGGGRLRVTDGGIRTNEWNHVVIAFDGKVRTIYLDGEQRAGDEVSVDDLNWGGRLRFGNRFNTPSEHGYAGLLDEIRIYQEALSPSQLAMSN